MAATFWGSGLKESQGETYSKMDRKNMRVSIAVSELNHPSTNPATPLAKHAALAVVQLPPCQGYIHCLLFPLLWR